MSTIENYFKEWRQNEKIIGDVAKTKAFLTASQEDGVEIMRKALPPELHKFKHINFWVDVIVRPLATDIKNALGFSHVDVLGPFGIDSNVALHFFNEAPGTDIVDLPVSKCVASITLSCDLNANLALNETILEKIDHKTNSMEYPKGSIGALNGLNKSRIPIPNDLAADKFMELLGI